MNTSSPRDGKGEMDLEEMHRCHRARLIGEAARMDGQPIDANPYGTFAEDDDSPNALVAAEWRYGWEHQDWVEQRASEREQDRTFLVGRTFQRRPLFTPLAPDQQPLNREDLTALQSSEDVVVRRLLATIEQRERVVDPDLKPCPFCGNERIALVQAKDVTAIGCPSCQIATMFYRRPGDARRRWNRRAVDGQQKG